MKATVRGVATHWAESGAGEAVLLVHGFPFHGGMWRRQLKSLPPERRWIVPDLRGFGESGTGEGDYTLEDIADDLAALLDVLELERATVCGLSMGGYIALAFWRRHAGRVRALALCDTRASADGEEARQVRIASAAQVRKEGTASLVDGLLPRLLSPETRRERPDVVKDLRGIMEGASPESVARAQEAMAARPDSTSLLPRIDAPVLVLAGADDEITPPAELEAMDAVLPDSRLVIIQGAGHVPPMERPEEFDAALLDFVRGLAQH